MSLAAMLGLGEFRQEEVRLKGCLSENRQSGGVRKQEPRQTHSRGRERRSLATHEYRSGRHG